jgi:type IV secretory pathway TraG/TraD family ATPase VirD4
MDIKQEEKMTRIGITDFRDLEQCFGIKEKNRLSHMYILGKTGTGKTTLLKNMIVSDIKDGNGVAVIDPHGDLSEDLLNFIPKKRIKDTIYFNPADLDYPIGFNPLNKVNLDYHPLVASNLISVFKKLWAEFWGPRMEYILRNAILTLLDSPQSSLLDLMQLLIDKDFRKKVIPKLTNPQLKDFWEKEFEKYSVWMRTEAISPIQNKVGQFLSTPMLRNIFAQEKSAFDVREILDQGKILIVNLAKGKIGEDMCALIGSLVTTSIELAALSRADTPEHKRRPFFLYIDEIQSFITLSLADMLSESRKYGLSLILTHQYLNQLDEKIQHSIFGNTGTFISFRLGHLDAILMAKEFFPVFDVCDLINLSNYHIYLKLMIDGVTSKPFSAVTLPPPQHLENYKDAIIATSRKTYAKPKSEVEKEFLLKTMLKNSENYHGDNNQRLF